MNPGSIGRHTFTSARPRQALAAVQPFLLVSVGRIDAGEGGDGTCVARMRLHPLSSHSGPPMSGALTLIEIRQLRSRDPKRYRARFPRFPVDESVRVERLDHLMHNRRCDSKIPLKVRFGRWRAVNLAVVVDEREILPLLDCERPQPLDCSSRFGGCQLRSLFGVDSFLSHDVRQGRRPPATLRFSKENDDGAASSSRPSALSRGRTRRCCS